MGHSRLKLSPSLLKDPIHLLALGFGSGLSPKAPGTAGTLMAIPLYLLLEPLSWPIYLAVVVLTAAAGIAICDLSARRLGVHDHPGIVWDEFVGYWITMFLAPAGWLWIVTGFVLFRIFDILKPWPISWLDRHVDGGLGIMVDDILAGLFAFGVMQGIYAWLFSAA
ncbi:MAG: phosphatidylglycerophosphatase A [Gammaproteobacteria bacterium]|nr:phosphatidylglycerophosphatase A [Gammaproteobacteria bacterium]